MKIAIFGTGYVGLVSAVGLADKGIEVYCIDNDESKIEKIKNGVSPIYEPGLNDLLKKNQQRISPTTNARKAIKDSDVIFIAVGTPFYQDKIDLSFIEQAAREIGKVLKSVDHYTVVVVKSTVIPGTTLGLVKETVLKASGKSEEHIGFCMNPEFLREGSAVSDFNNPDRIVLGVTSKEVEVIMRKVYSGFKDTDFVITNTTTAEMIKYTANGLLALLISYSNEIARICETLPLVDSEEVFDGVILDKRISPIHKGTRIFPQLNTYLRAGCGFGGSCFPKDVMALESFAKEMGVKGKLLKGLLEINSSQIEHVFNLGINRFNGKVNNIAVMGTAFKPDTDDVRESPGIKIARLALNKGINVAVHDYIALENTKKIFGDKIKYCKDPLEAVRGSDIVYITTAWDKYHEISDDEFEDNLNKNSIVLDTRSQFKDRENKQWRVRVGVGYQSHWLTKEKNANN